MEEIKVVTLENNKNYDVASQFDYNGYIYLVLCNEKNSKDVCIRKLEINNKEKSILRLKDKEFNEVLNVFLDKYNTLENNY